jgi:uroporphyrinogen-III synthase
MSDKTIVILRSPDECEEIEAAIKDRGFEPLAHEILKVDILDTSFSEIEEDTPLIFTSANAVRAFIRSSDKRQMPVYTVGRNTADEARSFGFQNVECAFGTAAELVDLLTGPGRVHAKPPLYIRAETISQDMKTLCSARGLAINEAVAYRSTPVEKLGIELLKKADSRQIAAIMFFSARGAQVFSDLIQQYDRALRMTPIKALCIGDGMIHSLSVLPFSEVKVASTPDRHGMIKLLDQLL